MKNTVTSFVKTEINYLPKWKQVIANLFKIPTEKQYTYEIMLSNLDARPGEVILFEFGAGFIVYGIGWIKPLKRTNEIYTVGLIENSPFIKMASAFAEGKRY